MSHFWKNGEKMGKKWGKMGKKWEKNGKKWGKNGEKLGSKLDLKLDLAPKKWGKARYLARFSISKNLARLI